MEGALTCSIYDKRGETEEGSEVAEKMRIEKDI